MKKSKLNLANARGGTPGPPLQKIIKFLWTIFGNKFVDLNRVRGRAMKCGGLKMDGQLGGIIFYFAFFSFFSCF